MINLVLTTWIFFEILCYVVLTISKKVRGKKDET